MTSILITAAAGLVLTAIIGFLILPVLRALKAGQKEYKELVSQGKNPHPYVLDDILPSESVKTVIDMGLVEIPAERIVGTKTAGRISAFTASAYLPPMNMAPLVLGCTASPE